MDITQHQLERTDLVVLARHDGLVEWSAKRSREEARWTSAGHGPPPVGGRAQLDLAAALDGIAAADTRMAPRNTPT